MKKNTLGFGYLILILLCSPLYSFGQTSYRLPKVLLLTTGADKGRGTVSDGVVLALQSFHKLGAQVKLKNRSILLLPNQLSQYDILILPTIKGYHDLPQRESLTYLSDQEMQQISIWVKNGGTLVAGENIGRNTLKGTDRITKGDLNVTNWGLADCFGVEMQEKNVAGFELIDTHLKNWRKTIFKSTKDNDWRLIPKPTTAKILVEWSLGNQQFAALTLNQFGKGNAFLLPTFWLLHPQNDGGLSSNEAINGFYQFVFNTSVGKNLHDIHLSPWKDGFSSVYCQTFDDGGNKEQYKRIIAFIHRNKLPTVFFVTPHIEEDIMPLLKAEPWISLQGHSFNHPDFRKIDFFQTKRELLTNRDFWKKNFQGFRFPYVSNSFWGMYMLNQLGFKYETSIAVNHFDFIRGSVVPYNIPIFQNDFFQSLDLLEISQMYYSDWHFYKKILEKEKYTTKEQTKDAQLFKEYLFRYFDEVIKPNNGVMVYLGHPMYTAINDLTLAPVEQFLHFLKKENVWITSLNEVAKRHNQFEKLRVQITEQKNSLELNIHTHGEMIEGLSFRLKQKPKKVKFVKKYQLKEIDGDYFLIFDALGEVYIKLFFK